MPNIAVLDNKIITTTDIYKFDINKSSPFRCFNCDNPLYFRQSRNADNNYTEHFYHFNNKKNTHIECEKNTLDRIRDDDTWHNKLSNFIEEDNREIIRKNDAIKHIVDAYDSINDKGIEFQNSPISVEAIQSRDTITYLDWIFNVENQYIRKVRIGNKIICEIPHDNWEKAVKAVKNKVYLYTGYKEWILLEDRESYHIEIDRKIRNVWIGKPILFQKIYNDSCLQNMLTYDGLVYFNSIIKKLDKVAIIYARCNKSMYLLDGIHRRYINKHIFQQNEIIAIKSVAGSGKTTTLLELSKIHNTKKILYLAFNKALITDINDKIQKQDIKNLYPQTFHSLVRGAYISIKKKEPKIIELKPQTIHNIIEWFKGKPFNLRKYYVDLYIKFCRDPHNKTPQEYLNKMIGSNKPLLHSLWNKTMTNELITFESLLKLCMINRWLKDYIDITYDIIMIDETQDFDMMMLSMLLTDTTIPKIFVGDPKQSIYQWRGCINGFKYLPSTTLIIEFYSTFRIGNPACEIIRNKFSDCWMISKSNHNTVFIDNIESIKDEKYTYLFRSWRHLLELAQNIKDIWICNYDIQFEKMRKLHNILTIFDSNIDDEEFSDDLPRFLRSITKDTLEKIICKIEENITSKTEAKIKFYTIHSYKGLEDANIRIANDIDNIGDEEEKNLYYVALTRGMKNIIEDK